jgi:hypothetical protein
MKDSTRRMRAAASPRKRKHWQAEREKAATPAYTVVGGVVKLDGKVVFDGGSNAAAWAWIDRHTVAKRYGGREP